MTETTEETPTEVVKTARDLREIEALAACLPYQAVARADHRDMPGGDAMADLAPVASPEAWEHVYEAREELGRDVTHIDDEASDWEPPLQTLLYWSEGWRSEHGRVSDFRPTVESEAAFLRSLLDWIWQNEPRREVFAKDVRAARVRLENTLYAGNRVERTRVPCLDCDEAPRLIKVYGRTAVFDGYKCPKCKRRYDADDFARAKHHQLASRGAERYVKIQDARDAIDRPERTFRQWMLDGKIGSYCDRTTRQVWVWWPDVRDCDLVTPRRNRAAS